MRSAEWDQVQGQMTLALTQPLPLGEETPAAALLACSGSGACFSGWNDSVGAAVPLRTGWYRINFFLRAKRGKKLVRRIVVVV
jgi:hypothetical protein